MTLGQLIAGAIILGGGYALVTQAKKRSAKKLGPATGLTVSPDCSNWEIVDETKTRSLSEEVYASFMEKGNLEPWEIADAIVKRVAPQCHISTETMRSRRELELYKTVFVETINRLLATNKIDQELYAVYKDEIEAYVMDEAAKLPGA